MRKPAAIMALSLLAVLASALPSPLIRKRADPFIHLHTDGWYYFCATVPEYDRIEVSRSRDLAGLAEAKSVVVWKAAKRGLFPECTLWAPELHYMGGEWYIYYASGTSVSRYDVRIFVLENDSADPMSGQWKDRGRLDTGWNTLSLDATSFEHGGDLYLVWAQRLTKADSSSMDLYIAKMSSPTKLEGKAVMIGRADQAWEMRDPANLKMQGPAVLERNGRVFIAYSSNATDARYAVGLMEASATADLLDPISWRKLPGPALESSSAAGLYGPGHNSFTTSPDGKVDYIVFHARDYEKVEGMVILDPNRATYVRPFSWDADGRPVFAFRP